MIGRVKWWSFDKGYGFIECNEDDNIFVHVKDSEVLETNFKENEMITFELDETEKGIFLKKFHSLEQEA